MDGVDLVGATVVKIHGSRMDEYGDMTGTVIKLRLTTGEIVRITAECDDLKCAVPYLEIS